MTDKVMANPVHSPTEKRSNDYMELEADILIDLLDYWQIENPILFGHSDGGSIALITAGKYPDRIAAVITEGAHIFVEDITLEGIHAAISLYKKTDLKQKVDALSWGKNRSYVLGLGFHLDRSVI